MDSATFTNWMNSSFWGFLISFMYMCIFMIFDRHRYQSYTHSLVPDQTPKSVASDLGLRFLPMSLLSEETATYLQKQRIDKNLLCKTFVRHDSFAPVI